MVAPYKHTGELDDLFEQELAELMALTRRCKQLLAKAIKPDGFNIGINLGRCAGAGILSGVRLPKQIAVMPLPNAILFPRVLLPLYIFEPRYKRMLADCLKGERMFAVALLRRGWETEGRNPTPYPIASIGVIRTCMARPDGS